MDSEKLGSLLGSSSQEPPETENKTTGRKPPGAWRTLLRRGTELLPVAIGIGFLLLGWLLFSDKLVPAQTVSIRPVITLPQAVSETAAGPDEEPVLARVDFDAPALFQASGWIEADPYAYRATALVSGVVESVEVLEGEHVTKGQVLARLIAEDAALDVAEAQRELDQALAARSLAESDLHVLQAESQTLERRIGVAEARLAEVQDLVHRYETLVPGAVPDREIAQARLREQTATAEREALISVRAELASREARLEAALEQAKARTESAQVRLDRMELALDRTRIRAPISGVVQRLLVAPGQKRMLAMDDPNSATIAILFDPEHLQARIDVPLEDAGKLLVGQPVRLRSQILPDTVLRGRVERIVGEADLQRNTLQVKVSISEPHPRLRPEMLCRAEFLASSGPSSPLPTDSGNSLPSPSQISVFVHRAALTRAGHGEGAGGAQVWLLDQDRNRLARRSVTLGSVTKGDHIAVLEGLRPGDQTVINPPASLKSGQRVNVNPVQE